MAKDALHNYKLDGENKIKVHTNVQIHFFHAHFSNPLIFRLRSRGSRLWLYICFSFCSISNNLRHSATFNLCCNKFEDMSSLPQYQAVRCSMLYFSLHELGVTFIDSNHAHEAKAGAINPAASSASLANHTTLKNCAVPMHLHLHYHSCEVCNFTVPYRKQGEKGLQMCPCREAYYCGSVSSR